ncbi:hypothetical protein AAG906_038864 [Vitis piasezkii]
MSSIVVAPICTTNEEGSDWMNEIKTCLLVGDLPKKSKRAHKIRARHMLAELHEGICGNHIGGRTLAHRAHSQGYYWLTMKQDVVNYFKKRPTRTTPFVFTYGMEAVIPIEIGMLTARTTVQGQRYEYLELERHLDWAEVRGNTTIQMASYQQRVIAHYNRKVRPRAFNIGTLILKKVFENTTEQ